MRRPLLALLVACASACAPAQAPPAPPAGAQGVTAPSIDLPSVDAASVQTQTSDAGASDAGASSPVRAVFVDTYDASLLFGDEIAHLRDVARDVVRAQRLAAVDPLSSAEQARLDALVASGRLHDGGPVCAQRPSLNRVVAAGPHAALYSVREEYAPAGGSVVAVEVADLGDDDTYPWWPHVQEWPAEVRMAASVPAGASVAAIEAALRAAPAARDTRGKRAEAWRLPPTAKRVVGHLRAQVTLAGAGWAALPVPETFAKEQPALDACAPAPPRGAAGAVTLAVDASGKVTRCEAAPDARQRPVSECACTALSRHAFEAGAADRRLHLEVTLHRNATPSGTLPDALPSRGPRARAEVSVVPADSGGVMPEDWEMNDAISPLGPVLAACFHPLPARHEDSLTATVDLDEAGKVTAVALRDADWLDAASRACVEGALRAAGLACPVGKPERHLALAVGVAR